jgi:hypothetical protein
VHALYESDDIKDSFYEELVHVFYQYITYDMNNFLGDRQGRCLQTDNGNESSHEISNGNGVRGVDFDASKT